MENLNETNRQLSQVNAKIYFAYLSENKEFDLAEDLSSEKNLWGLALVVGSQTYVIKTLLGFDDLNKDEVSLKNKRRSTPTFHEMTLLKMPLVQKAFNDAIAFIRQMGLEAQEWGGYLYCKYMNFDCQLDIVNWQERLSSLRCPENSRAYFRFK